MIVHLPKHILFTRAKEYADSIGALCLEKQEYFGLMTNHTVKKLPASLVDIAIDYWTFPTDMQLSSRQYMPDTHRIAIGDTYIGGDGNNQLMIAGP